ncbi:hypothetical protein BGZ80_002663, partial [Entomortierella chlamydospora]
MGKNFTPVQRININNMGDLELIDKVNEIVVKNGTPLILENLKKNNKWNAKLFTLEHLERHHGEEEIICRDLTNSVDKNSYNIESAAENLMVYIGRHGTWTPTHFDHCGAIGHNVMLWADKGSSSIWFMIATEDMSRAETLWESFGQNIEFENYFASVQDLAQADFPIHVLEQHVGDLVLIPSLGYHQVGKTTIKAAWNRLTTHCLNAAINVVLPRYKRATSSMTFTEHFTMDTLQTLYLSAIKKWNTSSVLASCESYSQITEEWIYSMVNYKYSDTSLAYLKHQQLKLPKM